ncbi:MAG: DICT sensory domain-containing protein [Pyrinomonadaceae bacterium]
MNLVSMLKKGLGLAAEMSRPIDLGAVANISRQDFDDLETIRFSTPVPCMEYLSLLIENAVLLRTNRSGRVYAGFERLSRMEPVVDRYLRLADVSERVYVFGVKDWSPPRHPHMKTVSLPPSLCSREWFVIANSSNYHVALIARDEDGFGHRRWKKSFSRHQDKPQSAVTILAEEAETNIDLSITG